MDFHAGLSTVLYPLFTKRDHNGVMLAVEEALINAIKHGNQHDPDKIVTIVHTITPTEFAITIEDQGHGFNPLAVPDPCLFDNLEKPSGRGLLLMRHYLTSVEFSSKGNSVRLIKTIECTQEYIGTNSMGQMAADATV